MATQITKKPFEDLIEEFSSSLDQNIIIAQECKQHLLLSSSWIELGLLDTSPQSPVEILRGANAAAIEAISFIALGLLRPAVLSLRSHFELSLMYTFYCTHPIEWNSAKNYQTEHKLPKAIKTYLANHYSSYTKRWNELEKRKDGEFDDCYKILSSVAHGSALNSISTAINPVELIENQETLNQAPKIFYATAEMISDIYVSHSISNWISLPSIVRTNVSGRFGTQDPKKILMFE